VTHPYCRELQYFRNKWYVITGAIWHAYLKEIGECTFAGERRTTFWQNCGGCHVIVTADAINFHLATKRNCPIWASQQMQRHNCNASRLWLFCSLVMSSNPSSNLFETTYIPVVEVYTSIAHP